MGRENLPAWAGDLLLRPLRQLGDGPAHRLSQLGIPVSGFYRRPSKPDDGPHHTASQRMAALGPGVAMFPKGAQGARQALGPSSWAGGSLGLLVDQKMNDGIAVPILRPAWP